MQLCHHIVIIEDSIKGKHGFLDTNYLSFTMSLSEEEIIRLYGKRWDIEVFFKICKTYLRLEKEFQCLSYDALTAHTAVVFTRYDFGDRKDKRDPRALGELFFTCFD